MTNKEIIQSAIKVLTSVGKGTTLEEESYHSKTYKMNGIIVKLWLHKHWFGEVWLWKKRNRTSKRKNCWRIYFCKSNKSILHLALILSLLEYDFYKEWVQYSDSRCLVKIY